MAVSCQLGLLPYVLFGTRETDPGRREAERPMTVVRPVPAASWLATAYALNRRRWESRPGSQRRGLKRRGGVTDKQRRPTYAERTHTTCPRCNSEGINPLPANNPGSEQEWFECRTCGHLWSQRRDRTPQGNE
jgi:hypothetical protein